MTDVTVHPVCEALDAAECWRLVKARGVGRVGFLVDGNVRVVPSRYDLDGNTAYFRASAFGALARGVHKRATSLQVNDVDEITFTGWSVLMCGTARRVEDASTVAWLWSLGRPHPWVPGPDPQWIALTVDSIEGQRVVG